ncbi:MAG TPA: hypothetical protein PLI18_05560 [Pirellulaceae bacterium]|nr:hypothetical protein [Pirellulaceae bacterium]
MAFDDQLKRRVNHLSRHGWKNKKVTFGQLAGDDSVFQLLGGLPAAQLGWAGSHLSGAKIINRRGAGGVEERVLRIALRGSTGATGYAEFETEVEDGRRLKYELKVAVRGGTAGATVPVVLGDVTLGQIKLDSLGNATVKFSTRPKAGEIPFPSDFRAALIDAGTSLSVGNLLSGTIGQGTPGGDTLARETNWKALASGSGARAEFEFEVEQEADGDLKRKLVVKVRGLEADSSFEVRIGGVAVGRVTTDERGRGEMYLTNQVRKPDQSPLPAGMPTIGAGTTAEIVGTELDSRFGAPVVTRHDTGATGTQREWEAKLIGNVAMRGQAKFELEVEDGGVLERRFVVTVDRARVNSTFVVKVGGVAVGDLQTDARGKGRLTLSSLADSRGELPMPTGLPPFAGARVDVGGVVGGFLRLDNQNGGRASMASDDLKRSRSLMAEDRGWLAGG